MTPHFTLAEFEHSDTALHAGLDNRVPPPLHDSAEETLWMMERIRAALSAHAGRDIPVYLSSGYRCLELNRLKGSKDTSDHIKAAAADWRAPDFGTPLEVCKFLEPLMEKLGIGQLIYERTWIHTSRLPPEKTINRVITARTAQEFIPGIVEV